MSANYNSSDISFSIRLGLLPTAILSVAVVASVLMLASRKPTQITITPAPVVINPQPIEVQVHTTVRPHISIKKVVVPLANITPDPVFEHRTPIVPDSLKKTTVRIGFWGGNS